MSRREDQFGLVLPLPRFVAWRQDHRGKWLACGSSSVSREELRARFPDNLILPYRERPA